MNCFYCYMNTLIFSFLMVYVFENDILQISHMILLDSVLYYDNLNSSHFPSVCQAIPFLFPLIQTSNTMWSYNLETTVTLFAHGKSTPLLP